MLAAILDALFGWQWPRTAPASKTAHEHSQSRQRSSARPSQRRYRLAPALNLTLGALVLSLLASNASAALQLSGRLEWVRKVEMRVVENGVIAEVLVAPGEHVDEGDLLLRMDQREARAVSLEAKAGVARQQIAREDAERALERAQELFDRGLIASEELKDAELLMAVAEAELESAKAQQAAADVLLERTELHAPFDGIIVEQNGYQGTVIYKTLQQQPLIAVAPTSQMLARVLVTSDILRRYRPGQSAKVSVRGQPRTGVIYSLGVEAVRIDPDGAVYELDVIFDSKPDEILRPSEFVQVTLP
ncbi:MAG: efflux RND transporter periplasmic adaptor subunit [Lamprobacter sp.]|uniref:efflux RND transporter periplasmic adaptor subunit n=1 Tax=Lamprobacter sp. TaxID=3100796 RepID=UPI002B25C865|nr:efflux RND transporter periplasmic adaptor subunit [Lamprobacter sp.]MEA3640508.1 efflux RND transporter periplasmic adaptor subunit [Lamprobacter sp.]